MRLKNNLCVKLLKTECKNLRKIYWNIKLFDFLCKTDFLIAIFMKGTVKWFDSAKGYGFITTEAGSDIFVHYTGINKEGFRGLEEGQKVEFEVGEGKKGEQAINVTVVE